MARQAEQGGGELALGARSQPRARVIRDLLVTARPKQWTKNSVVFVGLIFSLNLTRLDLAVTAGVAFLIFCLLSSSGYIVNDIADREQDRWHPAKRQRPLATGQLSPYLAGVVAAVMAAVALAGSFALDPAFALVAVSYYALTLAYTLFLKRFVILDVFAISGGFVLRAVAGAVVIAVPISPWLYVCTVLLALFLGFTKRRQELLLMNENAQQHRPALAGYQLAILEAVILIVTASTIMAYSLYTFSAENLPRNHAMMLTIPFVLYGVFRYLYVAYQRNWGGSPEDVLLRDRPLLIDVLLWIIAVVVILYRFGP